MVNFMPLQNGSVDELHAIVSGDVQGVGFRFFARRAANQLGLSGFVRNLCDGTVEVVAQGDRGRLEQFARRIRQGPSAAVVDKVDLRWQLAESKYGQFEIRM